jgi:hypothetical protein
MNTETIRSFIALEENRIAEKFANDLDKPTIHISASEVRVWAFGTRAPRQCLYECAEGLTADEAAERLRAKHYPSRSERIEQLRDQARDALRQAAELEKGGAS